MLTHERWPSTLRSKVTVAQFVSGCGKNGHEYCEDSQGCFYQVLNRNDRKINILSSTISAFWSENWESCERSDSLHHGRGMRRQGHHRRPCGWRRMFTNSPWGVTTTLPSIHRLWDQACLNGLLNCQLSAFNRSESIGAEMTIAAQFGRSPSAISQLHLTRPDSRRTQSTSGSRAPAC